MLHKYRRRFHGLELADDEELPPMKSKWPRLPVELLSMILQYIEPRHLPWCALVCKNWSPVAAAVLYSGPQPQRFDPRQLIRTLIARPDYAQEIRTLRWIFLTAEVPFVSPRRLMPGVQSSPADGQDLEGWELAFEVWLQQYLHFYGRSTLT